jgi:DNA ligase-1
MTHPLDRRRWLAQAFAHSSVWTARAAGPLAPAVWQSLVRAALTATGAARAASAPAEATPPPLLLARVAGPHLDVTRYLVSEKLDGVRAYWTGERLLFRSGGAILAPAWFTDGWPRQPLDGELWLARGRFDAVSGLLRQEHSASDPHWRSVIYQLFELPDAAGDFAGRYERLAALSAGLALPHVHATEQRRVTDRAELTRWLNEVIAAGGEGLMLHQADAPYVTGRSEVLLKLKAQLDAEAVVIAHLPGKGRHAGRVGALQVRNDDGHVFAIGSGLTDELRDRPPAIGSVVVYRYRGLTPKGVPRFATFWRVAELQ